MSNEKLREALQGFLTAMEQGLSIHLAAEYARQALATTEPVMANGLTEAETDATASVMGLATTEPKQKGMPEVKPWDHPEPQTMRWSDLEIRWIQAYGEQCWKAGYKHGAWGDKPEPTSKQSLQVGPAVNQQLTTEPVDEREAFEKWLGIKPCGAAHDFGWSAWQARAAMEKGVKG